jgi:hypothetical protein
MLYGIFPPPEVISGLEFLLGHAQGMDEKA